MYIFIVGKVVKGKFRLQQVTESRGKAWRIAKEIEGKYLETAESLKSKILDSRMLSDYEMISFGAFSPLEGFMTKEEYELVLDNMRLLNGCIWTIPITLPVSEAEVENLKNEDRITLKEDSGKILGILNIEEIFEIDKGKEAKRVYRTEDINHPGVKVIHDYDKYRIAGKIEAIQEKEDYPFMKYRLKPAETRNLFKEKGWNSIVAFQTRNPIHRAHEYIQKCALEIVDGLLIHPLMGETKDDDIPADVRWKCYLELIENYYPEERVALTIFPSSMRYAGPMEAIYHAIVRKNYGCTHIIIGRDHAGVGKYYGTYDAQEIFKEFDSSDLEITPLYFEHAFYCKKCDGMASFKICPHDPEERIFLSGTKVRELLRKGELPPKEFTRPEIAQILK